ncbi:unnamed protein product [Ceutorhynchus assimilis]|uniref:Gustatory receptor n=1 Tax=Ceutorhynchus assimilis TaxID=467358 RepID=A0A9N9QIV8_9CUCU|nr:unnamed protein product [Ceutorhynchus assimilis]
MLSFSIKRPLRVFLAIAEFSSILPHKDYGEKNKMAFIMLIKSIVFSLMIVILTIHILQYRMVNVHPHLNSIYVIVDILRTINNLVSILSYFVNCILKNKLWIKLYKITNQLKTSTQNKKATFLLISLIYTGLCDIALVGMSLVELVWNLYEPICASDIISRITHIICFYYENSSAVTISIFTYAIEQKLEQMHQIFRNLHKNQLYSITQIKMAKRLYLSATDINCLINNFFGFKILICFINAATRLLWLLITVVQMWNPDKFKKNLKLDMLQFIVTAVFGLLGMIPPYLITMSYAKIATELDYLLMNCYKLEDKFLHESYEHKEIESLWRFISENRLRFTALDFFRIEPWALLGIIASSTTYFIALIQFN